jgi:hypothetical protein
MDIKSALRILFGFLLINIIPLTVPIFLWYTYLDEISLKSLIKIILLGSSYLLVSYIQLSIVYLIRYVQQKGQVSNS